MGTNMVIDVLMMKGRYSTRITRYGGPRTVVRDGSGMALMRLNES